MTVEYFLNHFLDLFAIWFQLMSAGHENQLKRLINKKCTTVNIHFFFMVTFSMRVVKMFFVLVHQVPVGNSNFKNSRVSCWKPLRTSLSNVWRLCKEPKSAESLCSCGASRQRCNMVQIKGEFSRSSLWLMTHLRQVSGLCKLIFILLWHACKLVAARERGNQSKFLY